MEKKILKKYIVTVFSGGSIETTELAEENSSFDYSKLSARVAQIIRVLQEIDRLKEENLKLGETEIFTTAIKHVANELLVENTSVVDKLTRQLGETADSIRGKIFAAHNDGSAKKELKDIIIKNVSIRNKARDEEAVNYYFNNIFK